MKISFCDIDRPAKWRVTWRAGGKAQRRYFKTKGAAKQFGADTLEEIKSFGRDWFSVPPHSRAEIVQWWKRSKEKGYTFAEACLFFEAHKPTMSNITVDQLCTRFVEAKTKKGLRSESLRILKVTLDQFKEGRETKQASEMTTEEVSKWMDKQSGWGPWRRRGAIIDLGNLFSWGVSQKLLTHNPVAPIERPIMDSKTPIIVTVERAKDLLKLCREKHAAMLPWLAVSLFAGLRTAEVERLNWGDIGDVHIKLAGHQTKGRSRRLVTVRPALKAWLGECDKGEGLICPKNHRKMAHLFRVAAGGLPKNVLRHSFISYALGAGETIDRVAMESGNTPEIIFEHYREIVTPKDAELFWALRPT